MKTNIIDFTSFVSDPHTDWISGRKFGEAKAKEFNILDHAINHEKMIIKVDDKYVKAINDSFIKGFFSNVFRELKSKALVENTFEIDANEHFKRLIYKNWSILEALYLNSSIIDKAQ